MFFTKTTASILDTFTNDLQEVVSREAAAAAREEGKMEAAIVKRDAALEEGGKAQRAITNITALFNEE